MLESAEKRRSAAEREAHSAGLWKCGVLDEGAIPMVEQTADPEANGTNGNHAKGDDGDQKSDERMRKDAKPAWWSLLALTGTATLLLGIFGFTVKSLPVALVEMLLGATALSVGAFFGFLFGMPRPAPDGSGDSAYRPSTNLEQVSDWLTKILIGAGLVELASLRDSLAGIGTLVSKTVTPAPNGAGIVSQLVVLVFLVVGFLSSFLWTRLYYGRIQTLTDRSLSREVEALKRETKESIKALAKGGISSSAASGAAAASATPAAASAAGAPGNLSLTNNAPASQLPSEIEQKIEKFMEAPRVWDSDPNVKLFRGATREANGRRLDSEVVSDLGGGLLIKLTVVRVSGDPLIAETLFLLHPTIPQRIHRVVPRDNVAETSFYAEGTFTAVAIADNGQTVLAYDLANLKGAPKWFRDN